MPKRNKKRRRVSKLKANDYGIHLLVGIKGPRAWKVTIYRDGTTFNRLFSFSRYGGREAARKAADACRDQLLLAHLPKLSRDIRQRIIATNTSGYPGVHYRCYTGIAYWVARTTLRNGSSVTKLAAERRRERCRGRAAAPLGVSAGGDGAVEGLCLCRRSKWL